MIRRLIGILAAAAILLPAAPAFAQTAPAPTCQFQFGFATMAGMIPNVVGNCTDNQQQSDDAGDTMQATSNGLMTWTKSTNVTEFTNGNDTWVWSGYGMILRNGDVNYNWEGTTSIVAGIAINAQGQVIDPRTGQVIPTDAHVKTS